MWCVLDMQSGNLLAQTERKRELNEWMSEIKKGDWGDVGVAEYDEQGHSYRIWPEET